MPLLKYTAAVNGFDSVIITKLDVLDELAEIPVCVGYKIDGKSIDEMPATNRGIESIEAVYENLPGWQTSTRGVTDFAKLPEAAKRYVDFLEARTDVEVGCVSTGPERNETLVREGSKLAKLLLG